LVKGVKNYNSVLISRFYPVKSDGETINDPKLTAHEVYEQYGEEVEAIRGLKLRRPKVDPAK